MRRVTAALVALGLSFTLVGPSAHADPGPPGGPGQASINASKQNEARQQSAVDRLQAAYQAADDRLQQVGIRVDQAVQAFDLAASQLAQAQQAAGEAQARAVAAQAAFTFARDQVGEFAAESYRMGGGDFDGIMALFEAHGVTEFADILTTIRRIGSMQRSTYTAALDDSRAAATAKAAADRAAAAQYAATQRVAAARDAAMAALRAQQAQVAGLTAERNQALAALAAAHRTTVQLEAEQQQAIAEAAARARLAREAAAREAAERAAASHAAASHTAASQSGDSGGYTDTGYHGSAASVAVAYALRQLGKPYVWGAVGPDSFDCSGLTMRAWEAAGVDLPHYAASQYTVSHPLPADQLMPGDLVFFATDGSDPSTIYHEAMYLGGGRIVEAPHTGDVVKIASLYIDGGPEFFARPD
jgi:cell wall-associated NlpC family hydrolase